jgi:hypothetical protein
MTTAPSHFHESRAHLRQAVHRAGPFVEKFARFGYAAKGVVYVLVGVLAAMAAFGNGGETTGSRGAMETLADQPFGRVLLGLIAFGLIGYALWQFIRSIEDPENEGSNGKGIAKRIGFFGSGVIHFALVICALGLMLGKGGGGGDDEATKSLSARAMSYPMGQWLVAGAGIGLAIYGIRQLWRAFQANLDKRLRLGEINPQTRRAVVNVSRVGLAARGVVFGIIGIFLALAAYHHNPQEVKGVGGALETLREQSYGPWLLAAVAIGLIAYGVYECVKARYRQINSA